MTAFRSLSHSLVWICLGSFVVRVGVLVLFGGNLSEDVDAYLGHAETLISNGGFFKPGTEIPTAYRPPLVPLFYALVLSAGGGVWGIGIAQLLLGTATIWLMAKAVAHVADPRAGIVTALIIAFDPLLLFAGVSLMTETLFVFMLSLLFYRVSIIRSSPRPLSLMILGVIGGLLALARPGAWAVGGLLLLVYLIQAVRRREFPVLLRSTAFIGVGLLITVGPWVVRNWTELGEPIVTTTHGGYTLLLGNNDVFYEEVVQQPWGTTWDGESLFRWQSEIETEMLEVLGSEQAHEEIPRDRWMNSRARRWIQEHPGPFLEASWLRFRRFWALVPNSLSGNQRFVGWGIGFFYILLYVTALAGLVGWSTSRRTRPEAGRLVGIAIICLLGFVAVHLIYWSNMRMRAPIELCLAVFASGCVFMVNKSVEREPANDSSRECG